MKIYYNDSKQIPLNKSNKLNTEIYNIYGENTFVFITRDNYNILQPKEEKGVGLLDDTSNLTPDELLNFKVLYCVMDSYNDEDIHELLRLANQYKGSVVKHVIIK